MADVCDRSTHKTGSGLQSGETNEKEFKTSN